MTKESFSFEFLDMDQQNILKTHWAGFQVQKHHMDTQPIWNSLRCCSFAAKIIWQTDNPHLFPAFLDPFHAHIYTSLYFSSLNDLQLNVWTDCTEECWVWGDVRQQESSECDIRSGMAHSHMQIITSLYTSDDEHACLNLQIRDISPVCTTYLPGFTNAKMSPMPAKTLFNLVLRTEYVSLFRALSYILQ